MTASTSLAAYSTLDEEKLLTRVVEAVAFAGSIGMTCDEIADFTGVEYRSVTPRIVPLMNKGLVYRAGDTRKGVKGKQQLVVRLSEHIKTIPIIEKPKKLKSFNLGVRWASKIFLSHSTVEEGLAELKRKLESRK